MTQILFLLLEYCQMLILGTFVTSPFPLLYRPGDTNTNLASHIIRSHSGIDLHELESLDDDMDDGIMCHTESDDVMVSLSEADLGLLVWRALPGTYHRIHV